MIDAKNPPSSFQNSHPHSVVVIGAGISGLCAAYFLRQRGFQVTVVERDESAGGKIKTVRENGWLVELCPNSALENTPLFHKLFEELSILPQRVYADRK